MTTNPAELLFNIFTSWRNNDLYVKVARNDDNLDTHIQAVELLIEIEYCLTILEKLGKRTNVPRKYLPHWRKIIFNYPRDWSADYGSINEPALDALDATIDLIDKVCPTIPETVLHQLKDLLTAIQTSLQNDETLPDEVKMPAQVVIDHMQTCLDNLTITSSLKIHDAVCQLLGALLLISNHSRKAEDWKNHIKKWAEAYFINQLPGLPAASSFLTAITN